METVRLNIFPFEELKPIAQTYALECLRAIYPYPFHDENREILVDFITPFGGVLEVYDMEGSMRLVHTSLDERPDLMRGVKLSTIPSPEALDARCAQCMWETFRDELRRTHTAHTAYRAALAAYVAWVDEDITRYQGNANLIERAGCNRERFFIDGTRYSERWAASTLLYPVQTQGV